MFVRCSEIRGTPPDVAASSASAPNRAMRSKISSQVPQPPADVVPLHVRLSLPERPAALHCPVHVMSQVPDEHVTFEPAPTVCVHLVPTQSTLQLAPHVPVQVAVVPQAKLQPAVSELHASKAQVCPEGHAQLLPLQTDGPQPTSAVRASAAVMRLRRSRVIEKNP
jgi:hypothetical protein